MDMDIESTDVTTEPTVAIFRPDDDRLASAADLLESKGMRPVADPMLSVEPTGETPRTDADYAILTSKTGAELVSATNWTPADATLCAIGSKTAGALERRGYDVDVVPDEFTSQGLVDALGTTVDGSRVEVARSDHGSPVLLEGLSTAGAYVHETILYRLTRPDDSGTSVELAAEGSLDAACFTSSLTVRHFLDAAREQGVHAEARAGLNAGIVGVIGPPTRETAEEHGIDVDVVAPTATVESLVDSVCERLVVES